MGRLFGTDGVRGVYGRELTDGLAFDLGRAAVRVLAHHERPASAVVIGRDTRASGPALERALADGIEAAGADAVLAEVMPTPGVAFLTADLGADAGAVISASHNPPQDNGIKFFGPHGDKLPDGLEDEIEAELGAAAASVPDRPGRDLPVPGGGRSYAEHLVSVAEAPLTGMRLVVDCANGAASVLAPEVLGGLGAEVDAIFAQPDGRNINVGCGALHPEVVAAAVVEARADAGIALDGDADRALFADAEGNVVDGDQVLAACAVAMKDRGSLVGDAVVTTVMANLGFHRAMREHGIDVVSAQVGDRYVLEAMRARGAVIGGEQSGHVIFAEHATTGDGLLTAIRFLSLARSRGVSVAELAGVMRRFPQVMRSVRVEHKERLEEAAGVWEAVQASEAALRDSGRVLVRASGTEPLVRVMVEADSEAAAAEHASRIARTVEAALA